MGIGTMTSVEMAKIIGKRGEIRGHARQRVMAFEVRITDIKNDTWDRTLFEIEPVAGTGHQWVDSVDVEILG